jgi:uncharacterized membrane protein
MGAERLNRISRWILAVFYISAGINHFVNPAFYLPLIPPYFPFPEEINILSGLAEVVLGGGVLFPPFSKQSLRGIILLLIAFIPSHIYFIQIGSCIEGGLCTRPAVGWFRLVVIHPLLILWAYYSGLRTLKTT